MEIFSPACIKEPLFSFLQTLKGKKKNVSLLCFLVSWPPYKSTPILSGSVLVKQVVNTFLKNGFSFVYRIGLTVHKKQINHLYDSTEINGSSQLGIGSKKKAKMGFYFFIHHQILKCKISTAPHSSVKAAGLKLIPWMCSIWLCGAHRENVAQGSPNFWLCSKETT